MIECLTASHLASLASIRHGFFTRQGGVSEGIYASLNGGVLSADDPQKVMLNRSLIAQQLGVTEPRLLSCSQIHSLNVVTVRTPWEAEDRPEADAMVTDKPDIALAVQTADCAPVLLADAESGVVGAVHAGWRGAFGGILGETVQAMLKLGARREKIVAAIGPCIWRESYEVGPEFQIPFLQQDALNARFFRDSSKRGHFLFDLPGYVASRLAHAGVLDVSPSLADTYTDPARFFSYRRNCHEGERKVGSLISAIVRVRT